jgi:hypothetical protein
MHFFRSFGISSSWPFAARFVALEIGLMFSPCTSRDFWFRLLCFPLDGTLDFFVQRSIFHGWRLLVMHSAWVWQDCDWMHGGLLCIPHGYGRDWDWMGIMT